MYNSTEKEEKVYLHTVIERLFEAAEEITRAIQGHNRKIIETKKYMWENSAQLDLAERAANRVIAYDETVQGEEALKTRERIKKMMTSPYFGRIDFSPEDESENTAEENIYIGIGAFTDKKVGKALIYDWRAPISSMFYDFENGKAFYHAPAGIISGMISLKRQYKIKDGSWKYMIESGLNIHDEILQQELSHNSSEKMKAIVATIQKEQNIIIRNETATVLIIQGAAGSGKTSIALHRVAFLLYRFRNSLKSDNIMILSPNRVFSSYISNVLPELGEENIAELEFEELAKSILGKKIRFQTFSDQVEELLAFNNSQTAKQIQYKSTNSFVGELEAYLQYAEDNFFVPRNLDIDNFHVNKEDIRQSYTNLKHLPVKKRLQKIASHIITKDKNQAVPLLDKVSAQLVKKEINAMFLHPDTLSLYADFYTFIGHKEYFLLKEKGILAYSDVFPLIYVKLFFEGNSMNYRTIKHLLVDEMQDYAPIQYAVLAKLFFCKMTILGDSYQTVNPYSSSSADKIAPYFKGCKCVELQKSYRSTCEIMELAQSIQKNDKLIPMERHGEKPRVHSCTDFREEIEKVYEIISDYKKADCSSLGILCKTQEEAAAVFHALKQKEPAINLIDFKSAQYTEGIIITTTHLAKGLEFDWVIVFDVSQNNYKSEIDKGLLYIACTRAMHRLDLTFSGYLTDCLMYKPKTI